MRTINYEFCALFGICSFIDKKMDCEVVFMLQNKIAVVTGGTRGIGYAIVQKFLQNGAKVVLFGSREETVVKAVASLKEENPDWDVSGA